MLYNVVMEKDKMMAFRLPEETRDALQRAADGEQRSLSNMTVRILTGWLTEHGYLDEPAKPAGPTKKRRG
jgi:hypothetical protein